MNKNKLMKDFQKGTRIWHKDIPEELHDRPCIACGITPDKLLKISELTHQIENNKVEEIVGIIEKKKGVFHLNGTCTECNKNLCKCSFRKGNESNGILQKLKEKVANQKNK